MRIMVGILVVLMACGGALAAEPQETDVVVIGGGGAGLVAAAYASMDGADVVVLEKMPFLGGNTLYAGGAISAVAPKFQEPLGIEDSLESQFEDTWSTGGYRANPDLVRTMVETAPEVVDFMVERGVVWNEVGTAGGQSTARHLRSPEWEQYSNGVVWIQLFSQEAEDAGADLRVDSEVVEILREDTLSGRVTGVRVREDNGDEYEIHARQAVIVTAGGFGNNPQIRERHDPTLGEGIPTTNQPGATGDGIIMAQNIGAAVTGMDHIQDRIDYSLAGPGQANSIFVNASGERFVDEAGARGHVVDAVKQQEGGTAWIINDSQTADYDRVAPPHNMDLETGIEEGLMYREDSLEALAEEIGVPVDTFVETVETYNRYFEEGYDPDFGKTTWTKKVNEPPFYAYETSPIVHTTLGGLHINTEAQVYDRRGEIIPGLYAAGEVTGGIHGMDRVGGTAFTCLAAFGKIAGLNAASE